MERALGRIGLGALGGWKRVFGRMEIGAQGGWREQLEEWS